MTQQQWDQTGCSNHGAVGGPEVGAVLGDREDSSEDAALGVDELAAARGVMRALQLAGLAEVVISSIHYTGYLVAAHSGHWEVADSGHWVVTQS